jgi:hypothetical protein
MFPIIDKEVNSLPNFSGGTPFISVHAVLCCPTCGMLSDITTEFDIYTGKLAVFPIGHRDGVGAPSIIESNAHTVKIRCPGASCGYVDDLCDDLLEFPMLWGVKKFHNRYLTSDEENKYNRLKEKNEVKFFFVHEHVTAP